MEKYPRVLIINDESFYKRNATGITIRSIFSGWPSEDLFEFHLWNPSDEEREGVSIDAVLIPPEVFPLNKALRKITGSSVSDESNGTRILGEPSSNSTSNNRKTALVEYTKYCCETWMINIRPLCKILQERRFVPDVIYTMGARFGINNLTFSLAKYYGCNVCVHYMDNWRETRYCELPSYLRLNQKLNYSVDRLEKISKKSLVISSKMSSAYSMEYGHTYDVIMNSVQVPDSHESQNNGNACVLFTYAGGLHLDRYKPLLEVEKAIKEMDGNARLRICTSNRDRNEYQSLFDSRYTEFINFVPHNEVFRIYQSSDVLIHIESFAPDRMEYTKYSLSTKIPEYMASGKPILLYAPSSIAVFEYVSHGKTGLCAENREMLVESVKKLSKDRELRIQLGKNGIRCARENHSVTTAQRILLHALQENAKREKHNVSNKQKR